MLHLKSIELVNFKGVSRLNCDFDDLTVLAGLNNSGKTTILQAVYLLLGSLPAIAAHPHIDHPNVQTRTISLGGALSPLGLRDNDWLSSIHAPDIQGTISGVFANGLRLELGVIRGSASNFTFTVSHQTSAESSRPIREVISEISKFTAAFLTPPGEVPSREEMVNGNQYQSYLQQGKGAQFWRNGIWWGIQTDGFESFAPVQQKIAKYFPDIELLLPTLGTTGNAEILVKYKEKGHGPLDIAQSGAGLRTFLSLTRILDQSSAEIILLDEPDAHLHASQQAVILDLMLDVAAQGRQVIITSHSPEIITRVPPESIRWVGRDSPIAQGGAELGQLLERLGTTPDIYLPKTELPEMLVYVEGITDRPIIEALVKWCRNKAGISLPHTLVIPHRDGRFEGPTLQGIARVVNECPGWTAGVIGVRDRDWYYHELPGVDVEIDDGDGWSLITLPCKEMENLFCDPDFLFQAYDGKVALAQIKLIVDEESNNSQLLNDLRYQVLPSMQERQPNSFHSSTKLKTAEETFKQWAADPSIRCRLVAGKSLLSRVRNRIQQEHSLTFYPSRVFERISSLPPSLLAVAKQIFPTVSFD